MGVPVGYEPIVWVIVNVDVEVVVFISEGVIVNLNFSPGLQEIRSRLIIIN
jgi:hypothetical protein